MSVGCSRFSWVGLRFGRTALRRTPSAGPPKISLFFSLSRHNFLSFFSLFGVLSLNFGGVMFEDRGLALESAAARRSAVGRHHTRVLCSWQWRTKTRSTNHGRCGPDPSRRRKEKTCRELTGPGARARLVVLVAEAKSFVGQLAKARARSEPQVLQRRMEQAWRLWCSILSCAARLPCLSLV